MYLANRGGVVDYEDIAALARAGEPFRVICQETKRDITQETLWAALLTLGKASPKIPDEESLLGALKSGGIQSIFLGPG